MEHCSKLVSYLMHSRTQAHVFHLQTNSFAEHKALNDYYDRIIDRNDTINMSNGVFFWSSGGERWADDDCEHSFVDVNNDGLEQCRFCNKQNKNYGYDYYLNYFGVFSINIC